MTYEQEMELTLLKVALALNFTIDTIADTSPIVVTKICGTLENVPYIVTFVQVDGKHEIESIEFWPDTFGYRDVE